MPMKMMAAPQSLQLRAQSAEFRGVLTGFGREEERQEPHFLWFMGSIWDGALHTWPRDGGLKGQRQAPCRGSRAQGPVPWAAHLLSHQTLS